MCWDRVIDIETVTDARVAVPQNLKRPADAEPSAPAPEVLIEAAAS